MSRVVVVDYGSGNLLSVAQALRHVGAEVFVSDDPIVVGSAERLVVPGVGAFGKAMAELAKRALIGPIRTAGRAGRPLLGICLGMEILFDSSEEFGHHQGLGLIAGRVVSIPRTRADGQPHKIPHIGWNSVVPHNGNGWASTLLADMGNGFPMYFVHSFMAEPALEADWIADTDYNGWRICAAVRRGNLYGFQGHLEKSGEAGLKVLQAFVNRS